MLMVKGNCCLLLIYIKVLTLQTILIVAEYSDMIEVDLNIHVRGFQKQC